MNRFRPQDIDTRYIMRQRRMTGRSESYNWQTRRRRTTKESINRKFIVRNFQYLHHYARHAPATVQKQWDHAYRQFEARHFASRGKASMRFLNTWTAHAWL